MYIFYNIYIIKFKIYYTIACLDLHVHLAILFMANLTTNVSGIAIGGTKKRQ